MRVHHTPTQHDQVSRNLILTVALTGAKKQGSSLFDCGNHQVRYSTKERKEIAIAFQLFDQWLRRHSLYMTPHLDRADHMTACVVMLSDAASYSPSANYSAKAQNILVNRGQRVSCHSSIQ